MSALELTASASENASLPAQDFDAAPAPARRILQHLERLGMQYQVCNTRAPELGPDALAEALGCTLPALAPTALFRGKATRKPVLVIHSAVTPLSDKILSQIVGENVQRADAEFCQRLAGYDQGCIPPLGLATRIPLIMDGSLARVARAWFSLGAPGWYASLPSIVLARVVSARLVRLEG